MLNTTRIDETPTFFLSLLEAEEAFGVSRAELDDFITSGEVETVRTLDGRQFIVVGGALDSPLDEYLDDYLKPDAKGGE